MATIRAYTLRNRDVVPMTSAGGFDVKKWEFQKFKTLPLMHLVLDAITSAIEAGIVDDEKWVKQFFASKKIFRQWVEQYAQYDECYRTTDRWWQALSLLAGIPDEEGMVSSQEIAEQLLAAAEETGQI